MEKLQGYKINNQFFDVPLDLGGLRLIQAGRYFCAPDTKINTHIHSDFVELTIVNDGKGVIFANNQQIEVGKEDIFISFPMDTHAIVSDGQAPLQYDHLAFYVDEEPYKGLLQEILVDFYDTSQRVIRDSRINYLTYCILGEFTKNRTMQLELIKNTICNILVYVARNFKKKARPNSIEHATEREMLCNRIMNYVDTHIYSIEKLQDVAQVAGYNYNYISTIFAQTIGITLRDYFVNRKLEVANMLVMEGKLKICEIAEKLHYSSGNALTKAYKQKFGVAPKQKKSQL